MPIILSPEQLKALRKKAKRRPIRKLRGSTKPSKKPELLIRKQLNKLWKDIIFPEAAKIEELIKAGATPAELADHLERVLQFAKMRYNVAADDIVSKWKLVVSDKSSAAITGALSEALGVDIKAFLDAPEIQDVLAARSMDAANLIKTIPGDYLGEVARAVADNYSGIPLPEGRSLLEQIQSIKKVSRRKAELLARDQTSKLTAALNQHRQESIGIDSYIWRTSKDQRVVGNPAGLYPKGNDKHGNHWKREGKVFKWSDPPYDGHPGMAINDRCTAESIVDINKILEYAKVA